MTSIRQLLQSICDTYDPDGYRTRPMKQKDYQKYTVVWRRSGYWGVPDDIQFDDVFLGKDGIEAVKELESWEFEIPKKVKVKIKNQTILNRQKRVKNHE